MTSGALAGVTVVVTRPEDFAGELVDAIEAEGGKGFRFPVIDIVARDADEVTTEFAAIAAPEIIVFISRNAVKFGAAVVAGSPAQIAAVGPATAAALEKSAVGIDIVPMDGFDSEHLLAVPAMQDVDGKSITIVRGNDGRELLADTLRSRGASVQYLNVYARQPHMPGARELSALETLCNISGIDYITIMSVETLQNFLLLAPAACRDKLPQTLLVAPSERVIQTAQDLIPGISTVLAPGPQVADMVNTLIAHTRSGQN